MEQAQYTSSGKGFQQNLWPEEGTKKMTGVVKSKYFKREKWRGP